jgi:hypothetical protein
MFLCIWKIPQTAMAAHSWYSAEQEINKKQHKIMGQHIQYSGLALIIIGAILLITSYFVGWNNINAVNVGSFAAMIIGLIAYILGGKRNLEE